MNYNYFEKEVVEIDQLHLEFTIQDWFDDESLAPGLTLEDLLGNAELRHQYEEGMGMLDYSMPNLIWDEVNVILLKTYIKYVQNRLHKYWYWAKGNKNREQMMKMCYSLYGEPRDNIEHYRSFSGGIGDVDKDIMMDMLVYCYREHNSRIKNKEFGPNVSAKMKEILDETLPPDKYLWHAKTAKEDTKIKYEKYIGEIK